MLENASYTYREEIAIALKTMGFPQLVKIESKEDEKTKNWNGSLIELKANQFWFQYEVNRECYDFDNLSPTDIAIDLVERFENQEHL